MICRLYSICLRNIQNRLLYTRKSYIRQIFLFQMKYCLQSMYNHMVGRASSVVSPFYSILCDFNPEAEVNRGSAHSPSLTCNSTLLCELLWASAEAIVNEKPLNLEKTTSGVQSVLLLIYDLTNFSKQWRPILIKIVLILTEENYLLNRVYTSTLHTWTRRPIAHEN